MRLDSDSTLNRRYERILRRLCGRAGVLPTLFYIPHEELEKTSSQAVAGGGFADVYEGRYKGEKVALKVLRVYNRENLRKTQVVNQILVFYVGASLLRCYLRAFVKKQYSGKTSTTQISYHFME